ncbi:UDP-glycosyltransferase 79A2-like [Oryza brachyantha]|uniref:UDP-glycosyltransferase 79A2-like n=1 Tax=Oryza brachyantha TaxID=4533 RepID=UPI001ADA171C|nr:UDP-glycosyltransferase 79A2-like [Oryza brachyantha]
MASAEHSKKLRLLLIPFFATSHIGPFTDLAVRLATARPADVVVEATVAVTPANVAVVRSALQRHGSVASGMVSVTTYPFPAVDGVPPGVENLSAGGGEGWRISAAAFDEALTRPAQEALIRDRSPDALITDAHFWNVAVADELGVPCVSFSVISLFSGLDMHLLAAAAITDDSDSEEATVAGFPVPEVRIPRSEVPDFLTSRRNLDGIDLHNR